MRLRRFRVFFRSWPVAVSLVPDHSRASQSAMDVSAETLISQLRQHAPVCMSVWRAQPAIIRLLGAGGASSNIEQRCGLLLWPSRRPCHPPDAFMAFSLFLEEFCLQQPGPIW